MNLPQKTVTSWSEFHSLVGNRAPRGWLFRGQSNAEWKLESSLHRSFKDSKLILEAARTIKLEDRDRYERIAIERFVSSAHLFLQPVPERTQTLDWLALMQHYGAPTRLLDFTYSPFVAAYFATESGVEDAAVYMLRRAAVEKIGREMGLSEQEPIATLLESGSRERIGLFEPRFFSQRQLMQQGAIRDVGR